MYSNEINAFFFFFFFMILCLCSAPLISSKNSLSHDYYSNTCPRLDGMVWWGVANATIYDPRMSASLLRLHFHDCFVNGCDASVLLDDTPATKGEKSAAPNKNSLRGFEVIDRIKAAVEKECPNKVSCADILTLASRAAVKFALYYAYDRYYPNFFDPSEPWNVPLGRLDGKKSNISGANSDIPSPILDSVDTLITKFHAKGLNIQDLVALSGAHTIGLAKCSSFKNRLYSSNSRKTVNHTLLQNLKKTCPNNSKSDNKLVHLDWKTNNVFDNSYYNNLLNKAGVLKTDQDLASHEKTSWLVDKYSKDKKLFIKDFGESMKKMGNIGVITAVNEGEIRKTCGSINSN